MRRRTSNAWFGQGALTLATLSWLITPVAAHDTLFVGNSFILSNQPHGVVGVVEGLEEAQGGFVNARRADVSKGGYTLTLHASDADGSKGETPLRAYLVTGAAEENLWRTVVLQEQSQTAGFHIADNPLGPGYQWDASVLATELLNGLVSARGADTMFLMTWGYLNGDSSIPEHLFDGYPDYLTMQAALAQGYQMYASALSTVQRTVYVAPAGLAFQKVYDDLVAAGEDPLAADSPFSALYSGDGRHPALQGSYLAGATLYASLSGRDPRRLDWAPGGISAERRALLLDAAATVTIDTPYAKRTLPWGEVFRYPWLQDWSELVAAGLGEAVVSSPDGRPTAVVEMFSPPVDTLVVGNALGEAGRVGVLEGGTLTVNSALTLGDEGEGQLDLYGGELSVGELVLARAPQSHGLIIVTGGTLHAQSLSLGEGEGAMRMSGGWLHTATLGLPLALSGGGWVIEGPSTAPLGFTLTSPGRLHITLPALPSETPMVSVGADTTLEGLLVLSPGEALYSGSYVLLEGALGSTEGLEVDTSALGAVEVVWSVEPAPEGAQRLVLTVSGAPEAPAPVVEPEDDVAEPVEVDAGAREEAEPGPRESAATDVGPEAFEDEELSIEATPAAPAPSSPEVHAETSGCDASGTGTSGVPGLLLLVLLLGLGRRAYWATASQASTIRLG